MLVLMHEIQITNEYVEAKAMEVTAGNHHYLCLNLDNSKLWMKLTWLETAEQDKRFLCGVLFPRSFFWHSFTLGKWHCLGFDLAKPYYIATNHYHQQNDRNQRCSSHPSVYSAWSRPRYASHLLPTIFPQVKHRTGMIIVGHLDTEARQTVHIHTQVYSFTVANSAGWHQLVNSC